MGILLLFFGGLFLFVGSLVCVLTTKRLSRLCASCLFPLFYLATTYYYKGTFFPPMETHDPISGLISILAPWICIAMLVIALVKFVRLNLPNRSRVKAIVITLLFLGTIVFCSPMIIHALGY